MYYFLLLFLLCCCFVDCNIATERRRDPGRPTGPSKPRERRERERERDKDRLRHHRSRSPPSRWPAALEYEARLRQMERLAHGPPFHDPFRDPYFEAYGPAKLRDPYARPREDPYDRHRDRMGPYPYHPPRDPHDRERDMFMYDRFGPPPGRDSLESPPPSWLRGGPPPRGRGSPPVGEARAAGDRHVDMEIIVVNKQQK